MARPSKYDSVVKPKLKYIPAILDAGFSQKEVAEFLGINEDTLYEYKKKHKEFSECFDKTALKERVRKTFFARLTGEYKAVREVYKRTLNENTGEYEMLLDRVEKYELPMNEGAYKMILQRWYPDEFGDNPTTDIEETTESFADIFNKQLKERVNEEADKK